MKRIHLTSIIVLITQFTIQILAGALNNFYLWLFPAIITPIFFLILCFICMSNNRVSKWLNKKITL